MGIINSETMVRQIIQLHIQIGIIAPCLQRAIGNLVTVPDRQQQLAAKTEKELAIRIVGTEIQPQRQLSRQHLLPFHPITIRGEQIIIPPSVVSINLAAAVSATHLVVRLIKRKPQTRPPAPITAEETCVTEVNCVT